MYKKSKTSFAEVKSVAVNARVNRATRTIEEVAVAASARPAVTKPSMMLTDDKTISARKSSATASEEQPRFRCRTNAKISVRARSRMLVAFI